MIQIQMIIGCNLLNLLNANIGFKTKQLNLYTSKEPTKHIISCLYKTTLGVIDLN